MVARTNDLMEMCGVVATDREAFMAAKLEWSKAFMEKLVQLGGIMWLLRAAVPGQEQATGTSLEDSLESSIKEMVMVNQWMLDTILAKEPLLKAKAAFLKDLMVFSGR